MRKIASSPMQKSAIAKLIMVAQLVTCNARVRRKIAMTSALPPQTKTQLKQSIETNGIVGRPIHEAVVMLVVSVILSYPKVDVSAIAAYPKFPIDSLISNTTN